MRGILHEKTVISNVYLGGNQLQSIFCLYINDNFHLCTIAKSFQAECLSCACRVVCRAQGALEEHVVDLHCALPEQHVLAIDGKVE